MSIFALYIDPTAAGLGLQMLLGGIVGGLVVIKLFWARVFSFCARVFSPFRRSKKETEETPATSEEEREATESDA
jgi:hypothetical protein